MAERKIVMERQPRIFLRLSPTVRGSLTTDLDEIESVLRLVLLARGRDLVVTADDLENAHRHVELEGEILRGGKIAFRAVLGG
jgi:hypothetical protein